MSNMIATVSLSGVLVDKLRNAAAAGFDGVEIFEPDLIACDLSPAEIRTLLADLGLACGLYQPFRDLEGLDGLARERAFERARRKFALMDALGAETMLLCSNVQPEASADRSRMAADLAALGDLAHSAGKRVAYEALAWAPHVHDHRVAWAVVRAADHPAIGLALDSFHSLARGIPAASILDIPGNKIFFCQLADAPMMSLDLLSWSRHFRSYPGQGDLPLVDFVAALFAAGYQGPLSLEVFSDRVRASASAPSARDAYHALAALREDARCQLGYPADMPAREPPDGIAFVEFAANDAEAAALEALLGRTGFAASGAHRSKRVRRWRQGSANIVINCEDHDFPHSYDIVHGASVCAAGIAVRHVAAVLDRATGLGYPVVRPGRDGEDTSLPALVAPGGMRVHLVPGDDLDALWQAEFCEDTDVAGDAGIFAIDHVSASVMHLDFLSAQLFWTSLFALRPTPIVNLSDPAGMIESRALESGDGAVRLTMSASAGHDTLSSRFIGRTFGALVHHLAFRTHDIFATAAAWRAAGTEILAIPHNYYDDLEARMALPAELVGRLRTNNILYDRDEGGDYFQLYTRALDRRFFFEAVERRGYRGYGAVNAPVRLAAQNRFRVPETI